MTVPTPTPSPPNPAESLVGLVTDTGWRITERLTAPPDDTGGNFSVPYLCERLDDDGEPTGQIAFLKALDYSRANRMPGQVVDNVRVLADAFIWERDLVTACADSKMRNVVVGLEAGYIDSQVPNPFFQEVAFIVFERASGTVRREVDLDRAFHLAWMLRVLHQTANGIRQLHNEKIFHQDLKPSNVLTFGEDAAKIADLGRASKSGTTGHFDHLQVPGDRTYAPPELLYGDVSADEAVRRRSSDLYQLGGLLAFLFCRTGTTAGVIDAIDPTFHPGLPGVTYDSVLPMVRDAYNRFSEALSAQIPEPIREDVMVVFRELSDPEPSKRGNRKVDPGSPAQYSAERYVSAFDRLARSAETRLKHLLS